MFPFNPENYPIVVNGMNVNNVNGNGTVSIGETVLQAAHSNLKLNLNNQVYGQGNLFGVQSINSPIIDPDGTDVSQPFAQGPSSATV